MSILRKLVAGGAATLALLGTAAVQADAAKDEKDSLIYLHSIEPKTFYQWWTQAEYPRRQLLDGLIFLDGEGKLHPWLAKSWKQDGTVWTFDLRDDVVFSDGSKFNAETVVKNVEFWLKVSTSVPDSFFKEAKAVDEYRVEIHTTIAQPWLANLLSSGGFAINSSPSLARDLKEIGENPIGSGPFVLKEWKRGEEIVLVRNENYRWGPETTHRGPAHLKTIHWKFVPDANARWLALEKGEADLIYDPPSVKWKEATGKYPTSTRYAPGRGQTLSLNTEFGPFADKRVRQAFAYASNRKKIVETLFRGSALYEGNGAYSRTTPDYVALDDAYPYDPDKAVGLLEEAGYTRVNGDGFRVGKDGKVLEVLFPVYPTIVSPEGYTSLQALQAEAKKVGFKIDLIALTSTDLAAGRYTKPDEYHVYLGYWTMYAPTVLSVNYRPDDGSASGTIFGRQNLNQIQTTGGSPNPHNRVRSKDWKLQEAIVEAHREPDPQARHAKLAAIQRHISDEALALGFYTSTYNLVGQKYLSGLIHNIHGPIFYALKKD
ncbi:ABC transporter substrate-binding protein [Azotobacter vinelandii]|uniref:ABC transporter substrate-binding protein n=1 Tax=Azotobacter vinelandii TaxID=354 RepID=UPI002665B8AB|nr:ABC transporter substrate-binding protein [Azotobacter vinelandii]WKN24309.1 ABC transporter substrate-binding protein [Azotobacter vinelandii]